MVIQIKPQKINIQPLVLRVFLKSIELLGGLKKLAEYRTLTWLPSIARACFAVVLKEELGKSYEEIAKEIGITKQTAKNILSADEEKALEKIKNFEKFTQEEKQELKVHTAGGLAKRAYRLIKEGHDEVSLFVEFSSQIAESVSDEIPWVYKVLRRIKEKEIDFPITDKNILDEFKGIKINGTDISSLKDKISFPIPNPAKLLKKIKHGVSKT